MAKVIKDACYSFKNRVRRRCISNAHKNFPAQAAS